MKSIEKESGLKQHQKELVYCFGELSSRHKINIYNLICLLCIIASIYFMFNPIYEHIIYYLLLSLAIVGCVFGLIQVYIGFSAEIAGVALVKSLNHRLVNDSISFIAHFTSVFYYKNFIEKAIQFWKTLDGFILSVISLLMGHEIIALMFFISRIARLFSLASIRISLLSILRKMPEEPSQ